MRIIKMLDFIRSWEYLSLHLILLNCILLLLSISIPRFIRILIMYHISKVSHKELDKYALALQQMYF